MNTLYVFGVKYRKMKGQNYIMPGVCEVRDSSHLEILFKKLRKYDAGILELGLEYNNKMAVPPG